MRHVLLALALCLPTATFAQTPYEPPRADDAPRFRITPAPEPPGEQSRDLGVILENGLESFFRDLLRDVEPHMNAIGRELGGRFEALAPLLQEAGDLMDDLRHYQAPERLENGDIVIRRKTDAPPPPPISQEFQDLTRPPAHLDPRRNHAPDQQDEEQDRRDPQIEL